MHAIPMTPGRPTSVATGRILAVVRALNRQPSVVALHFPRSLAATLLVVALATSSARDAEAMDPPRWQVEAAAFEATMNVTAMLMRDGWPSGGPNDRIAVFAQDPVSGGTEIRGVADATTVGGSTLFFLTVYANADGEVLTLRHYVAAEDRVYRARESLVFRSNGQSGTVAAPATWSDGEIVPERPGWSVDPAGFGASMRVTAVVDPGPDGVTEQDQLAAFVGDSVRGVTLGTQVGGRTMFFLTVYGMDSGEEITFRFHDQSRDLIHPVEQTVRFAANAERGSTSSPLNLAVSRGSQSTARERPGPPSGLEELVSVFPNPATSQVFVQVGSAWPGSIRVRLTDLLGRTLDASMAGAHDAAAGRLEIDVTRLATAPYLVVVETPTDRSVHPIFVRRTP